MTSSKLLHPEIKFEPHPPTVLLFQVLKQMAFTSAAQEAKLAQFLRGGDCGAGQATFLPLHSLLQHRKQDWLDFCKVGIVELVRQFFRLIKVHHIKRVVESLKIEFSMVLGDGTVPDSKMEECIFN